MVRTWQQQLDLRWMQCRGPTTRRGFFHFLTCQRPFHGEFARSFPEERRRGSWSSIPVLVVTLAVSVGSCTHVHDAACTNAIEPARSLDRMNTSESAGTDLRCSCAAVARADGDNADFQVSLRPLRKVRRFVLRELVSLLWTSLFHKWPSSSLWCPRFQAKTRSCGVQ